MLASPTRSTVQEKSTVITIQDETFTKPTLCCQSQKTVAWVCTNPQCSQALQCGNDQCPTCVGKHKLCGTTQGKLIRITQQLNNCIGRKKEFIERIRTVDEIFMSRMIQSQQQLSSTCSFCELNEKDQRIVNIIYRQKEGKNISGRQAKEFVDTVGELNTYYQQVVSKMLDDYTKQMSRLTQEAIQIKRQIFRALESQLTLKKMQSNILKEESQESQVKFEYLMKALNQPRKLKLLYRASENAFSAGAFHEKCDNTEDTLTLVRTQFGRTLAGFTHYKWNQVSNGNYVNDKQRKSFILQMDLRQKMVPNTDSQLIVCNNNYGPIFGYGPSDLCIVDKCNLNSNSGANFPNCYNLEGPNKYAKGQETFKAFSGCQSGYYFRVEEYEVFKVIY